MIFTKMQGLGNNYVVFDQLGNPANILAEQDYPELSRSVSDINFGIGSDGIILIGSADNADFKMRIFNKDGSEAKNCGNGLRCVAKYLYDNHYVQDSPFTIETLGGVVNIDVTVNNHNKAEYITVDMGKPQLLKGMIPMKGDPYASAVNESYTFDDYTYKLTCLSMGNPHAILLVDDINDVPLEYIGPCIEHSILFPERVNVGVVHVKNQQEIDYRVWERGSGITMACGTGACASVAAAALNDLLDTTQPTLVHLPGGDLTIELANNGHVWMQGTASYICHGELA